MEIMDISPYGLLGILGFISGFIYLFFVCKNREFQDLIYVYTWAGIGAMLGAKVLYVIVDYKRINYFLISEGVSFENIISILNGGFVFYGGLAGALIATIFSCQYLQLNINKVVALITPAMPLAHTFGRIGCAIVGCCYGIETETYGIIYENSPYAPLHTKLFPVQLIEALGNFVIFLILIIIVSKKKYRNKVLITYLYMYSIFRFFLEFLRGDIDRGFLWILSTSQWISIIIFVIITLHIIFSKNNSKNGDELNG